MEMKMMMMLTMNIMKMKTKTRKVRENVQPIVKKIKRKIKVQRLPKTITITWLMVMWRKVKLEVTQNQMTKKEVLGLRLVMYVILSCKRRKTEFLLICFQNFKRS